MMIFLRVVMILFALFEIINNIKYLKVENGIKLGYDQHFEIPPTVSMEVMKKKIITMLIVGIVFLTSFIMTFVFTDNIKEIVSGTFIAYAAFAWIETLYYRTHAKAYVLAVFITVLASLAVFVA